MVNCKSKHSCTFKIYCNIIYACVRVIYSFFLIHLIILELTIPIVSQKVKGFIKHHNFRYLSIDLCMCVSLTARDIMYAHVRVREPLKITKLPDEKSLSARLVPCSALIHILSSCSEMTLSFYIVLVPLLYFPTPVPLLQHRSAGSRRRDQTLHLTSHSAWLCSGKMATLKPFSERSLSLFRRPEWVLFQAITWTAYQLVVMERDSLLIKTWGGEKLSGDALKISVGM